MHAGAENTMKKTRQWRRPCQGFAAAASFAMAAVSQAQDFTQLQVCAVVIADAERLACYDRLAAEPATDATSGQAEPNAVLAHEAPAPAAGKPGEDAGSILSRHWELDRETKRGLFNFRPHRKNYLLATYSHAPNEEPYRALGGASAVTQLSNADLAFQLSFKLKFAENVLNSPLDLWFGYTQRSFWQVANPDASSPFRETNYQPELMALFPTDLDLLGLRLRFVNFGFVHESNGQPAALSRSWNRAYAQVGLERGNFSLLARRWIRTSDGIGTDDNPDISDYLGRGDIAASYRWKEHELSLLARQNFDTGKGGAQIGWTFPLSSGRSKLKGYVQYFSGYGHSLIDYNSYQRVFGIGIQVTD
jgi:phospholipase A1